MIKKSYAIQMSYDVTDNEKRQAERALLCFDHASKILNQASEYLNIMKTPFKNNNDVNTEEVMGARAAIRRFRDKSIENFNNFKVSAFKCVNIMQEFASDTQTIKLIKSFISTIDDLEHSVNEFSSLFDNLQANDFAQSVVEKIETIQKNCDDVEEIIDERIKKHIQSNILARSWVDSISNDLQMKVEEKTPLILDLFNKKQDQFNEAVKDRTSEIGE